MTSFLRDFRYAIRVLAKSPGATAVAVLALALGIGVNASCFTSVNALILEPLPFPELHRVMTLWETVPKLRAERDAVAPANFLDWKREARSFEQLAAYRPWNVTLTGTDDPQSVDACQVTAEFFAVLGMKPLLGRTFSNNEGEPRDNVVVVSHSFWERHLASSPEVSGKTIDLGGRSYTVIGVMPDEFDFPLATDLWTPLVLTQEDSGTAEARLAGGAGPRGNVEHRAASRAAVSENK